MFFPFILFIQCYIFMLLSVWDFHGIMIWQAVAVRWSSFLLFLQNHPQTTFILLDAFLHSVVVSPVWSSQVDMSLNRRVLFLPRCFWRKRCFSVLCDSAIGVPLQETSFVSAGSYTVLMELLSLFNLPYNTDYWQLMRMKEFKWRKITRSRWAYNAQTQNISGTNLGIV